MLITTTDITFELKEDETLLEGLERTGHEIEYQCRLGYCGSCRVKIISGNVSYQTLPLAFIGKDEILPCCCTVKEPIEINASLRSESRQDDLFSPDLFDDNI